MYGGVFSLVVNNLGHFLTEAVQVITIFLK